VNTTRSGSPLSDKALPNNESRLRAVFDKLATRGRLLIMVDQPNTIGALPVTVARACGHDVAYLSGLSMRRIADLYPVDVLAPEAVSGPVVNEAALLRPGMRVVPAGTPADRGVLLAVAEVIGTVQCEYRTLATIAHHIREH